MDIAKIIDALNWIALNIPWDLVIASGVLSPVLLGVKKWFSVQSEKVMMTLVIVFGAIGATVSYLVGVPTTDPTIIAVHGLVISALSQPFYYLLVKPASKWLSAELAKAAAFDAEVKSAAIPADGLPISQTK